MIVDGYKIFVYLRMWHMFATIRLPNYQYMHENEAAARVR